MTDEQIEKVAMTRARLIKATRCKNALSAQFDKDQHQPELEKQLFSDLAKYSRIEAECYEAYAAVYE